MHVPPKKLRPGDELTVDWLNRLLGWVLRNTVLPGAGLTYQQNDQGIALGAASVTANPGPLFFSPSGAIAAATGRPGTGNPGGPLNSQTIYQIADGKWEKYDSNASVYNPYEDAIAATLTASVKQNADGTYSVDNQGCT